MNMKKNSICSVLLLFTTLNVYAARPSWKKRQAALEKQKQLEHIKAQKWQATKQAAGGMALYGIAACFGHATYMLFPENQCLDLDTAYLEKTCILGTMMTAILATRQCVEATRTWFETRRQELILKKNS